ncbi:hypothetical protein B0H10DRAFT_1955215 [Mycena sp. CBHHK59/15]|nr:hypothetical protein B0H10DRAFT_1955215 [Mycena sp. CBHHK59/15]
MVRSSAVVVTAVALWNAASGLAVPVVASVPTVKSASAIGPASGVSSLPTLPSGTRGAFSETPTHLSSAAHPSGSGRPEECQPPHMSGSMVPLISGASAVPEPSGASAVPIPSGPVSVPVSSGSASVPVPAASKSPIPLPGPLESQSAPVASGPSAVLPSDTPSGVPSAVPSGGPVGLPSTKPKPSAMPKESGSVHQCEENHSHVRSASGSLERPHIPTPVPVNSKPVGSASTAVIPTALPRRRKEVVEALD